MAAILKHLTLILRYKVQPLDRYFPSFGNNSKKWIVTNSAFGKHAMRQEAKAGGAFRQVLISLAEGSDPMQSSPTLEL